MPQRFAFACAALIATGACTTATGEAGWTGSGAQPFDAARAECQQRADTILQEEERAAALEECMAEQGWRRGS